MLGSFSAAVPSWVDRQLHDEANSVLASAKQRFIAALDDSTLTKSPSHFVARCLALARVLSLDEREAFAFHGHDTNTIRTCFERQAARASPLSTTTCTPALTNWVEQKAIRAVLRFLWTLEEGDAREELFHVLGKHAQSALAPRGIPAIPVDAQQSTGFVRSVEGTTDPFVGVCEDSSGAGGGYLIARQAVAAFSPLLRIPGRKLFNAETVRRYSDLGTILCRAAWKQQLDDEGEALLLTCLVYERAKWRRTGRSNWDSLLQTCPTSFPGVPTNWSAAELVALDGTSVLDEVAMKHASLETFVGSMQNLLVSVAEKHPAIFEPVFTEVEDEEEEEDDKDDDDDAPPLTISVRAEVTRVFSSEEYQWARCVFDSRSFHLLYGSKVQVTMAPVADMINHTATGTHVLSRRIEPETGDFVLEAAGGIGEDDVPCEVVMSYGPLQTWELLLSYGFVPMAGKEARGDDAVNEHDRLPFAPMSSLINTEPPSPDEDPEESTDDGYDEQRREIIAKHGLALVDQLFIPVSGVAPPIVRAVLRLCQAEAEDFPQLHEDPFRAGPPYLDERVDATLRSFAESAMGEGGVEDDAEEDSACSESDRMRMAAHLRLQLNQIARRMLQQ